MITDDPIRDLERQLVRAAATLGRQPDVRTAPFWRRGRRAGLGASAVAVVAAALLVTLGTPGHQRGSIGEAAAAQLSPYGNRIVHVSYTSTFFDGRRVTQRVRVSTWYSASVTRTVATTLDHQGHAVSTLETVTTRASIEAYESSRDVASVQMLCPGHPREATDPVARLRGLLAAGRLTDDGTQQFAGATVQRLRTSDGPLSIVFLVRQGDGAPVAMTTDVAGRDRTVVRFTGHRTAEATPAAERDLAMGPHPGAKVVRLPQRCP